MYSTGYNNQGYFQTNYVGYKTLSDLQSLIDAVMVITNRRDLLEETKQAIFKATLKEHTAIDYPSDLVTSAPIELDNSGTNSKYHLDLNSLGLNGYLRKIKMIGEVVQVELNAFNTYQGYWGQINLQELAPNNLFDNYNIENQNYYFRQGNNINVAAMRPIQLLAIMYYQLPTIKESEYSSWIADRYPYIIYEHAAADIFQTVGKRDEFTIYRSKIPDNRLDVIKAEISTIG